MWPAGTGYARKGSQQQHCVEVPTNKSNTGAVGSQRARGAALNRYVCIHSQSPDVRHPHRFHRTGSGGSGGNDGGNIIIIIIASVWRVCESARVHWQSIQNFHFCMATSRATTSAPHTHGQSIELFVLARACTTLKVYSMGGT